MTSLSLGRPGLAVSRRITYLAACGGVAALMAGCGAAASAPTQPSPSPSPTAAPAGGQVTLDEYKVTVPATMKAGNGNFHIVNSGKIQHELLVFKSDLNVAKYPVDTDGRILEEDASIAKISDGDNLVGGGAQDRAIDLSKPGTYVFVCNLPAHYTQGMFAVVTVTQ